LAGADFEDVAFVDVVVEVVVDGLVDVCVWPVVPPFSHAVSVKSIAVTAAPAATTAARRRKTTDLLRVVSMTFSYVAMFR
jgi:hypothetical protein